MPRFRAQFTNMHAMLLLLLTMTTMSCYVGMAAAQLFCDPLTQYERGGECCKKCPPGTSMSNPGQISCQNPDCQQCLENFYMDKYTTDLKCEHQPYCDPNVNFQAPVHVTTKRTICQCKLGYHCSAAECITCVRHTACKPGSGVQSQGNRMHDTVCQKCPKGTYSSESSVDGACKKWTECEDEKHIEKRGTETSDNICVKNFRTHVPLIGAVIAVISVTIIGGLGYCLYRAIKGGSVKAKDCAMLESCLKDQTEPPKEAMVLITNPTDPGDEEHTLPEMQSSQEEGFLRTPEENEVGDMEKDLGFTDNGNLVMQDNGKSEKLPRQESQTQTCTDINDSSSLSM